MCRFITLPSLFLHEYWIPQLQANFIDMQNKTHELTLCESTIDGMVCSQQSAQQVPCFLEQRINACKWTILPITELEKFIEVNARHVCFVTNDKRSVKEFGLQTLFVGCLRNMTHLFWKNTTYTFFATTEEQLALFWHYESLNVSKAGISLEKLNQILNQTKQFKDYVQK